MPLPFGVPGSEDDPFGEAAAAQAAREAAAARLGQRGRQEGATTSFLERLLPTLAAAEAGKVASYPQAAKGLAEGLASLPQRATQSAAMLQQQGDVYDPAAPVEAAMLTMGATPFGAPRGAIGAGPTRSALPMDEASRVARMNELGYTRDAYRGEGKALSGDEYIVGHPGRYDPGFLGGDAIYSTNAPRLANDYSTFKAAKEMEPAPNVAPLKVRMDNPKVITGEEKSRIAQLDRFERDDWLQNVYKQGHDGVLVRYGGPDKNARYYEEYVTRPENYRSRFAEFNPANEGTGFLLGSGATDKRLGALALAMPTESRGDLFHGISKVKLPRPVSEMFATHVPTAPIAEKTITPEALQGGLLLPAWGDRSLAGSRLTQVGEQALGTPIEMQGGHGFMPANVDAGVAWASGKPVIGRLAKQVQTLADEGKPVYFPYTAMGERSVDFSHHVSDTLAEMVKGKSVPTKTVADFNTGMRAADANFPAIEDWPGLRSPKLKEYLATASGDVRNKFAKLMDTREFQAGGMPSVAEARFAITDPSLLDVPTGAAGRSIARLDPEGRVITDPTTPHRTYSTQLGGQYVGGLPLSIPKEVMYPDMLAAYKKMGYEPFRYDYLMQRGVKGAPIAQRADQKWLDTISKFLEANRQGQ